MVVNVPTVVFPLSDLVLLHSVWSFLVVFWDQFWPKKWLLALFLKWLFFKYIFLNIAWNTLVTIGSPFAFIPIALSFLYFFPKTYSFGCFWPIYNYFWHSPFFYSAHPQVPTKVFYFLNPEHLSSNKISKKLEERFCHFSTFLELKFFKHCFWVL